MQVGQCGVVGQGGCFVCGWLPGTVARCGQLAAAQGVAAGAAGLAAAGLGLFWPLGPERDEKLQKRVRDMSSD